MKWEVTLSKRDLMERRWEAVGADISCSLYEPSNVLNTFEWIILSEMPYSPRHQCVWYSFDFGPQ